MDDLKEILKTLAAMHDVMSDMRADLKYHIKRTDMLEEDLRDMRLKQNEIETDLRPVVRHVGAITLTLKFLAGVVGAAGAATVVARFFL